jgi:hypothetical protein
MSSKMKVDISDPEAIKQALDETTLKVAETKARLDELITLRNRLAVLNAGLKPRPGTAGETIQRTVHAAVDQIGGPTRAADVAAILPPDTKRETINWALWKSESDGLIKKLDTGVYAPLDYEPDQAELLAATNGAPSEKREAESRPVTSDEAS